MDAFHHEFHTVTLADCTALQLGKPRPRLLKAGSNTRVGGLPPR
jgi:hypothetical protein